MALPTGTRPFARFEWMLAGRYLRSRRQEKFISIIAGFSFIGIMLGVATLIVVMAVMNGFRTQLIDKILGLNGHMIVQVMDGKLTDYGPIADRIATVPGVVSAIPLVEGQALASGPNNASGVLVRGIRQSDLPHVPAISNNIRAGSLEDFDAGTGIAIGSAGNLGYISAFDYSVFQTRTLLLNNSGGNVGIGHNNPVNLLDVFGDVRIGSGTTGCLADRDGTIIAGLCSSDIRYKRNVKPFGSLLHNFSKLRPVNFYWRREEFAEKHFGAKQSFGLIAQEVEQAFPDLVSTDDQGYKVVNYSKLPLLTIQAVNEQQVQIETQQKQIEQQLRQQTAMLNAIKVQQATIEKLTMKVRQLERANSHRNRNKSGR